MALMAAHTAVSYINLVVSLLYAIKKNKRRDNTQSRPSRRCGRMFLRLCSAPRRVPINLAKIQYASACFYAKSVNRSLLLRICESVACFYFCLLGLRELLDSPTGQNDAHQ